MKRCYYQVVETIPTDDGDKDRLVWLFDNESDAVDLVQFLCERDVNFPVLHIVESYVEWGGENVPLP